MSRGNLTIQQIVLPPAEEGGVQSCRATERRGCLLSIPRIAQRQPLRYRYNQDCKPGSVFDSHLSRRTVAGTLKPPRERPGQPTCSHSSVAPDRVYSDGQFPAVGCALTAPFHPYPHRRKLHILRTAASGSANVFRCASSPRENFVFTRAPLAEKTGPLSGEAPVSLKGENQWRF